MPPLENALDVYEEALFYNIEPLIEALSLTCPVAGYKMRRLFLDKVGFTLSITNNKILNDSYSQYRYQIMIVISKHL